MCCFSQWCITVRDRQMENPSLLEREINSIQVQKPPIRQRCVEEVLLTHGHNRRWVARHARSWFSQTRWGSGKQRPGWLQEKGLPSFERCTYITTCKWMGQQSRRRFSFFSKVFCNKRRDKDGWRRREGRRWKCRPRRRWRNRCWAAGTWQRLKACKR